MDKHYNPAIYARLQQLAGQSDWQGVLSYIHTLSNAQFRTAGYMLGERIMPALGEAATWEMACVLCNDDAKAFLVTLMKTIAERIGNGELPLRSTGARAFLAQVKGNTIDRQKVAMQLLPVLALPDDIRWLMRHLDIEEGRDQLALLLRVPTKAASYALFCTLRYAEHDRPLEIRGVQQPGQQAHDGSELNTALQLHVSVFYPAQFFAEHAEHRAEDGGGQKAYKNEPEPV